MICLGRGLGPVRLCFNWEAGVGGRGEARPTHPYSLLAPTLRDRNELWSCAVLRLAARCSSPVLTTVLPTPHNTLPTWKQTHSDREQGMIAKVPSFRGKHGPSIRYEKPSNNECSVGMNRTHLRTHTRKQCVRNETD